MADAVDRGGARAGRRGMRVDDESRDERPVEAAGVGGGARAPSRSKGGANTLGVVAIDLQNAFFVRMKKAGDQAAEDYGVNDHLAERRGQRREADLDRREHDPPEGRRDPDRPARQERDQAGDRQGAARPASPSSRWATRSRATGTTTRSIRTPRTWRSSARGAREVDRREGEVGLLVGSRGNFVSDTREEAFVDTMKQEFPNVKVVSVQPTDFDAAKAADIATTWSTSYPDMKGFGCISDSLCLSAQSALQSAGKDLQFVGVDGDAEMQPFLRAADGHGRPDRRRARRLLEHRRRRAPGQGREVPDRPVPADVLRHRGSRHPAGRSGSTR